MNRAPPLANSLAAALGWLAALAASSAAGDELRLAAPKLLEISTSKNVRLTRDGAAIELERGILIEDDGPAAGYSYQPNEERIAGEVWIKKDLLVSDPRAEGAVLLVGGSGEFFARINGRQEPLTARGKTGGYWQRYDLPKDALRPDKNEIVLHGMGKVWIARDDEYAAGSRKRTRHPNRSAKSSDGGKTWSDDRLGSGGNVDGEYYVRLFLDQHRPEGTLTLPVIDLGNLEGQPIAPPVRSIGAVRVSISSDDVPQGRVAISVRSGPSCVPSDPGWSAWQPLVAGDKVAAPAGRYLQTRLRLTTNDPRHTPKLSEVVIAAEAEVDGDWHRRLRVAASDNRPIVRTSIPFEYEPLDHPRLKMLREKYKLDEVVAGTRTELELIGRLAAWSARQWDKGHLGEGYPPWDSLEILSQHTDGRPVGGFCQQYNVVFLQACESFGLCGRAVSIGPGDSGLPIRGGHEVVEIWSNEFGKWIYVDGNAAWYFIDRTTRAPLSLRELRQRQLQTAAGKPSEPIEIVKLAETRYEWKDLSAWPPFAELRLIPRSNFLEQKSPLPLNQGMRGWFWTGHYVWTDEASPASLLYGNRVSLPTNWDWTLNQTHIVLEATTTPGQLRVQLDAVTPSFASFEVKLDGREWRRSTADFPWQLRPGKNRLEARSANTAGRAGRISSVELE